MLEALYKRIAAMDLKRPYIWELGISAKEFKALEAAVEAKQTNALQNVVYLAEWYRRCYDGGLAEPIRDLDCQELFEESGIEKSGNLFQTESGNNSWQYSIFVLGGVAIPFEQGKKNTRFLKELCRIYYGEEGDVDSLGEKDRAVAFKESVRSHGSLYHFLRALIENKTPFAEEDLADKGSPENSFVERIKSVNNEVLKSKFELEWLIRFDPESEYMVRNLRLVLKSESLGGLYHQYLKFERVRLWGINPEKCRRIAIGVRFLMDDKAVSDPHFDKPILEYSATGCREAGFVAWGTERYSKKVGAPTEKFNKVEIIAQDDEGKEYLVESFKVDDWMQVFRLPESYCEWTSRKSLQRVSAVICPNDFEMMDVGSTEHIWKKRFWGNNGAVSDIYQWRIVYDTVRFKDATGKIITLFNRQGYDQIVVRLYHNILRYYDGCVNYTVARDDEYEESLLPLVFCKGDIVVRHFETKNDMGDGNVEDRACEKIEYLDGGKYREWTANAGPGQGKITLRLTVKGVYRKIKVFHLPLVIARDCENGVITIGDVKIEDKIVRDGNSINPVIYKSVGTEEEFINLEIWRATRHKEFIRNGKVVEYAEDGEEVEISYILKDGLAIHDFSEDGYREYDCSDIKGIYALEEFSPDRNRNLKAVKEQIKVQVSKRLDNCAPKWLWVNLVKATEKSCKQKMLYWDYISENTLKVVAGDVLCNENEIIFADLAADVEGLCVNPPQIGEPDPFAAFDGGAEMSPIDAFEVATKYRVYYFLMQPLREAYIDVSRDIFKALMKRRDSGFTEEDRRGLLRFAEEFGISIDVITSGDF